MKNCRYCAEEIQDAAVICKHCGKPAVTPEIEELSRVWDSISQDDREARWADLPDGEADALATLLDSQRAPPEASTAAVPPARKTSRATWGCLILIVLSAIVATLDNGTSTSSSQRSPSPSASQQAQPAPAVTLKLLGLHTSRTSEHYVTTQGQVRNISGGSLKNVLAVVTYYDGSGSFISTDNALVDYNPLLPGQTTTFSVMAPYNPAMKSSSIAFAFLGGSAIPHTR